MKNIQFECREVATKQFSHIDKRVEREFAAEQWLMRKFLNAESQSGWFAEIGANDPTSFSVTHEFEKIGWSGILVEPQPDLSARCREERPNSVTVEAACGPNGGPSSGVLAIPEESGHVSMAGGDSRVINHDEKIIRKIQVPIRTLDDILEEHAPAVIDLISIDVEGFTVPVLNGFTVSKWRPRLLLIEDNLLDFSIHLHPSLREANYKMVKRMRQI